MIRRLVNDEAGIALVLALITMIVLGSLTAAVCAEVAVNHRSAGQSAAGDKAFALAELGLSYAEGRVYSAASTHVTPSTSSTSFSQDGGTVTYSASVAGDGVTWTMVGEGLYSGVTQEVTAQADVPSAVTVTDPSVWNYLYANTSSCTNISGGTTVSVPILTNGPLCIGTGAHYTGTQLEVNGNLSVTGGANVGTSGSKVATVKIAGTQCTNGNTTVTPGTGVCDGTHSGIYATTINQTLDVTPQMPTINLASEYATQAALTKSGCPTNFPDNDSTLNNSVATATLTNAVFPSSGSYDCKIGSNEFKWNSGGSGCANPTLYVSGVFVFDGSISFGGGCHIVYSGQGVLYFTGTFQLSGGNQICGITNCTNSWNPDTNGIIIVAGCWSNSTGSVLVSSQCVHYGNGSAVQVGTYATTDYTIDGGSTNMGPVLANTLTISGGSSSLIPFHNMPPGTPLNSSTTYLPADPPTNWNG